MTDPIVTTLVRFDPEAGTLVVDAEDGDVYRFALGPMGEFHAEHIRRREQRIQDLLEANNRYLQRARDAESELADVRLALDLALAWLAPNEPGDSRAVSNEFVAMYAIQCGLADNRVECRAIISSALARAKMQGAGKMGKP